MKADTKSVVVTPAQAAVIETQITLTLSKQEAKRLWDIVGFDGTIPRAIQATGTIDVTGMGIFLNEMRRTLSAAGVV